MEQSKKIAVFDDDESILDFCKLYFADKGYEVKTFLTCDDACQKIADFKPQLIIMDCWMPPKGGAEAVKLIKADARIGLIPVVMFSANRDLKDVTVEVGAEAYLEKPFDLNDMDALLHKLIGS